VALQNKRFQYPALPRCGVPNTLAVVCFVGEKVHVIHHLLNSTNTSGVKPYVQLQFNELAL